MSELAWILNIAIAVLAAINTVAWGYTIREVGEPSLSLEFLFKLIFNRWFILAITTAFVMSILSYAVLREMGVLVGRFFLSLGYIATILTGIFILHEKVTPFQWIGILLILIGITLLGR